MEHLTFLDTFGHNSRDSANMPAAELSRSSSYRSDKGKSRALEFRHEDLRLPLLPAAGPSRGPQNLSEQSDHDIGSASLPDRKGKARQQDAFDTSPDKTCQGSATSEASSTSAARCSLRFQSLGTSAAGDSSQTDCGSVLSVSSTDDASLKRSICELGSSPSASPHQHTASLPRVRTESPCTHVCAQESGGRASTSRRIPPPSNSAYTQPGTANKKRCSNRVNAQLTAPDQHTSHQRHACRPSSAEGSGETPPHSVGASTSRLACTLLPASRESPSTTRSYVRRASLLVNSSTSSTRLPDHSRPFCVSPEPLEGSPSLNDTLAEHSEHPSAFIDDTRVQRAIGTIRRRRGFYHRDAEPLHSEAGEVAAAQAQRPSSATSDNFMSEFARAVDLRLSGRTDSMQSSVSLLSTAFTSRGDQRQASTVALSQRSAPQLPYVRAPSPLTVPFAAAELRDTSETSPQNVPSAHLRRRSIAQQSGRDVSNERSSHPTVSERRNANAPDSWRSVPTHLSSGSSSTAESGHPRLHYSPSYRRDYGRLAPPTLTNASTDLNPWGFEPGQRSQQSTRDRSRLGVARSELAVDDDLLVQQSARDTQRSERSRFDGGAEWWASSFAASRELQNVGSPREADHTPRRQADERQHQREFLPWRRTHFGLRAPAVHGERDAAAASQARFEPVSEASRYQAGRPPGLAGSGGSLLERSYRERTENETALEYLGRLMSRDSELDDWMAGEVHGPLLRMAIESEVLASNPHLRHLGFQPASTSTVIGHTPHLAFDARNFIADEDWAELNSYEGLMQLSERLGAAEVCVPQSLIDTLPTCEYANWDGGSCKQRVESSPSPPLSKGKGKQKVAPPLTTRDTMCPICREDYLDSDVLMSVSKCCHAFHADCIKTWFKAAKTCPLCRADAFDEIKLPALSFQSTSRLGSMIHHAWNLNF